MDAFQDCRKVPSSKLPEVIDKKQLAQAVKMQNKQQLVDFALGKQIPSKEILSAFKIETLGEVQIPISLENVERMKQLSCEAHCNQKQNSQMNDLSLAKTWQIDSSKVLSTTPTTNDISTIISVYLGLPTKSLAIEVKLDKIILWETGGNQHKSTFDSKDKFGSFGTVILQLPLEGGHEGGRCKVEYKGISKIFESHENSDQLFYLSAFYGDCKHVMEPVTRGWKLVLVFNLVWEDAKISETLQDFPTFLGAVKEVQKALTPWIPQEKGNMKIENITDSGKSMEKEEASPMKSSLPDSLPLKDTEAVSKDSDDEGSDSSDYYLQFTLSNEALKEQMLYFVLKEKYDVNNISINRLKGEDRNLAHLLQNCRFLEVHLAVVTLENLNEEINGWSRCSQESVSAKVTRWIDSNDASINLRLPINWYKQRVGPIRKLLTSRGIKPDREKRTPFNAMQRKEEDEKDDGDYSGVEEDFDYEEENEYSDIIIRKQYFDHFILVIWPKHLTYQMYCRYGLHSVLDRMENSLNSAPIERKVEARQVFTQELQKIVSFCHAHPTTALNDSYEKGRKAGELIQRLLRYCIALQAREEGLMFLKLCLDVEGITSEEVAQTIVDFLCQITGWDDCADLIKQMLTPKRIFKQLFPITKLGQYFFDANCLEGAKTVGDYISSSFLNGDKSQINKFRSNDIYSYVHFIVSLEANPITSNRERMECFVPLIPKLDPDMQGRLIRELNVGNNSYLFSSNEPCRFLFLELFKAFLTCDIHKNFRFCSDDQILDVLKSCIRLENAELLKTLISNICCMSTTTGTSGTSVKASRNSLLDSLLSSAFFWELGKSSELSNSAACIEWYRDTCKLFLSKDFVTPFNSTIDVKLKIVNCLLSLNDEQSWQTFALKICKYFPNEKSFEFLRVFLNVEIQQGLLKSSAGFGTFVRLMDHCTERWKSLKEPQFSWEQPEAYLPDYPEVEAFLRSNQESLTYTESFYNLSGARYFAKQLKKLQKSNGFGVRVKLVRNRKSPACIIVKKRSHHESIRKAFHDRKSEFEEFVKLREKLCEEYQKLQKSDDVSCNDVVMSDYLYLRSMKA